MVYVNGVPVRKRIMDLEGRAFARLALVGFGVGVFVWILALILQKIVISPLFCDVLNQGLVCGSSVGIAGNLASVFGFLAGLAAIIKLPVHRHTLIPLASMILLWGAFNWVNGFSWIAAALWMGIMYLLAYAFFGWLARIRNRILLLILAILAVVAIRLAVFFIFR